MWKQSREYVNKIITICVFSVLQAVQDRLTRYLKHRCHRKRNKKPPSIVPVNSIVLFLAPIIDIMKQQQHPCISMTSRFNAEYFGG